MLSTNRRCVVMNRLLLPLALGAVLGITGCGPGGSRPDFDIKIAHRELAQAFGCKPEDLAILGDGRVRDPDHLEAAWIVDFTLDGYDPFLQAKFDGTDHQWRLAGVRERPTGPDQPAFIGVGVMLGRFRGAVVEHAEETERRMRELAGFIERYTVEHGNRVPTTSLDGIRKLFVAEAYIEEAKWQHGADGWGGSFAYHGAPEGTGYIIVSPGADGRWDLGLETYFFNTDQGLEIYEGETTDPNKDIIWASGAFVQRFRAK